MRPFSESVSLSSLYTPSQAGSRASLGFSRLRDIAREGGEGEGSEGGALGEGKGAGRRSRSGSLGGLSGYLRGWEGVGEGEGDKEGGKDAIRGRNGGAKGGEEMKMKWEGEDESFSGSGEIQTKGVKGGMGGWCATCLDGFVTGVKGVFCCCGREWGQGGCGLDYDYGREEGVVHQGFMF